MVRNARIGALSAVSPVRIYDCRKATPSHSAVACSMRGCSTLIRSTRSWLPNHKPPRRGEVGTFDQGSTSGGNSSLTGPSCCGSARQRISP